MASIQHFFALACSLLKLGKYKKKAGGDGGGLVVTDKVSGGRGGLKIWLPTREDQHNTTKRQQGDQVNLIATQTKSSYSPTPCGKCQSVSFVKEKRYITY